MTRQAIEFDLAVFALRAAVEQETAAVLTQALGRKGNRHLKLSQADMFALRQFIGWHQLRFGANPSGNEVPQKLGQFIYEWGAQAQIVVDNPDVEQIHRKLMAAGLRRDDRAMSVSTLRQRSASVIRVYRATAGSRLPGSEIVANAIATLSAIKLRDSRTDALATLECSRAKLLRSCDGSLVGIRDRALLETLFATRCSITFLVRSNQPALAKAVESADGPTRYDAVEAIAHWIRIARIASGPIFRRVRADGRLGAPMTRQTVENMVARRLRITPLQPSQTRTTKGAGNTVLKRK